MMQCMLYVYGKRNLAEKPCRHLLVLKYVGWTHYDRFPLHLDLSPALIKLELLMPYLLGRHSLLLEVYFPSLSIATLTSIEFSLPYPFWLCWKALCIIQALDRSTHIVNGLSRTLWYLIFKWTIKATTSNVSTKGM